MRRRCAARAFREHDAGYRDIWTGERLMRMEQAMNVSRAIILESWAAM